MNWLSIIILLLMILPIAAILIFTPYLTRETVSFGVSISEEMYYSAPIRSLRKQYAWISGCLYTALLIGCLLAFQIIGVEQLSEQSIVVGITVTLLVILSLALNLTFHFKMKKYKAANPMLSSSSAMLSIDTDFRKQKLMFSNKWFIIHIAVTLCSALLALYYYDRFPQMLPMKFDFEGNVTREAVKSYRTLLGLNVMQMLMIGLFMFINWSIPKSKQQINPGDPGRSARNNAIFRRRWSIYIIITGFMMVLLFSFIQLNMLFELNANIVGNVSLAMSALVISGAVWLSITTGQGGSRISKSDVPSSIQPLNDDSSWKLGSIYYNPRDPAIFIEKRIGVGWTVNFGHPISWVVLIGTTAIIIVVSILVS